MSDCLVVLCSHHLCRWCCGWREWLGLVRLMRMCHQGPHPPPGLFAASSAVIPDGLQGDVRAAETFLADQP